MNDPQTVLCSLNLCYFYACIPKFLRGSSLVRRVVSLDKELYSTLSLLTQLLACEQALHLRVLAQLASLAQIGEHAHRLPRSVNGYQRYTAGEQPYDGLASRLGGVAILLGMLRAKDTGKGSGHVGLWLVCILTFYLPIP